MNTTNTTNQTTEQAFNHIMQSSLFRLNGPEIDLCQSLIDLCAAIQSEEETDWSLGEFLDCSLDCLLIGAHWALTEWHAGQDSIEYAAYCAIGQIFSPGMTSGPEPDSGEAVAYEMICEYFKAKQEDNKGDKSGETVNKFNSVFDSFACVGDFIQCEQDGYTFTATIHRDDDRHIDDDDCHNPDQSVTGCNDEQQEKLLNARKAWLNDEWIYCGIVLSATLNGVTVSKNAASLWGIECNYPGTANEYLTEVANELLPEAVEKAKKDHKALVDILTSKPEPDSKKDTFEYRILSHFLPYLINGDVSDLTEGEENQIKAFEKEAFEKAERAGFPNHVWEYSDCEEFAGCEVCKLYGAVTDLKLNCWK